MTVTREKYQDELVTDFERVWNKMSFIKDDTARSKAVMHILMNRDAPRLQVGGEVVPKAPEPAPPAGTTAKAADPPALDPTNPEVGSFSEETGKWHHCPQCGNEKIDHISAKGKYHACFECRLFLSGWKDKRTWEVPAQDHENGPWPRPAAGEFVSDDPAGMIRQTWKCDACLRTCLNVMAVPADPMIQAVIANPDRCLVDGRQANWRPADAQT